MSASTNVVPQVRRLDVDWVREQFPALKETVNGQLAVFFDAPGGTQVPQRVIDAISEYLSKWNANLGGAFLTSQRSDLIVEQAHEAMADFLNCAPDEVVFGANMTTLTFALSRAIGRELKSGDELLVTCLDHDANVSPWVCLEERGAKVRTADIRPTDCTLDMFDLQAKIRRTTKLVAVGWAANAVGTINDVREAVRMARVVGALTFVDAVHYAPHGLIDVKALDTDFLACSSYKFFGPHQGILYGKREQLLRLRPYKLRVCSEKLPDRWETGTQNHECMAGVTAAVDYIAEVGRRHSSEGLTRREAIVAGYEVFQQHERELAGRLIAGLLEISGLTFYGITDPAKAEQRTPTVAIRLEGYSPRDLAMRLGERGIFTWDGNYYAINLAERLGVQQSGGMLRIGLAHYNTMEEVERLLTDLRDLAETHRN
ncbi:MAG TPA: cysteine desulfurase-like protein [Candidatus Binatia bacterium]|jgi:cysteine desulfurase family protein (TIGR01976 family)|nr:cysteine desulfurase-like protein [Candidatus Binatia bacterium]